MTDRRGPGKTQVFSHPIKNSSGLSTKARIAEDLAKGPSFQGQSKYKGLRIPKKVNPPGESRSPVTPLTTNPQSPLDSPQRAPLPRPSNELGNQLQTSTAPLQTRVPPPPPPPQEALAHDIEQDHMDLDQPESVRSPYLCHFFLICINQPSSFSSSPARGSHRSGGPTTDDNTSAVRL